MTKNSETLNDKFWTSEDHMPVTETKEEKRDLEYREGETTHEHQIRVGKYVMKKWNRVLEYLAKN